MSAYQLFYSFWQMLFEGASAEAIASWCPLFAMLSVGGLVVGFLVLVAKIFK